VAGADIGLPTPLADHLWRTDPEQLRDLGHRRPFRLMIGPDLTDHPDRPLTQLDRVPR